MQSRRGLPTAIFNSMQQTTTAMELTNTSLSLAGHVISAHAKQSNFVFSPISIHVLLGMAASYFDGPTRDQILSFLTSKSLEELHALFSQTVSRVLADGGPVGGPILSSANGLWVDHSLPLPPDFRQTVENVYRAVFEHVDFRNKASEVEAIVNAWAVKETRGLIKDILQPGEVSPATKLILVNAVYFEGVWARKFDKSSTEEREFYLLNGSSVGAPMMRSFEKQYVECFDGFKVARLPYKQGEDTRSFSMCIYLPDAEDGLTELTQRVCSEFGFIDAHLPRSLQSVDDFCIPKFQFEFSFKASAALAKFGVCIPQGDVLHKARIEVNEEGTEAAAVSVLLLGSSLHVEKTRRLEFVADHPFLFVIREDESGLILFIGQLLNPISP